jgi:hypothetical protein
LVAGGAGILGGGMFLISHHFLGRLMFFLVFYSASRLLAESVVDDFGARATALLDASCAAFIAAAVGYEPDVVARKRTELRHKLRESLHAAFAANVQRAAAVAFDGFCAALDASVPATALVARFAAAVEEARAAAAQSLQRVAAASAIAIEVEAEAASPSDSSAADAASSSWPEAAAEAAELKRKCAAHAGARRKEQVQLLLDAEKRRLAETEVPASVAVLFTRYPTDMWARIRTAFAATMADVGACWGILACLCMCLCVFCDRLSLRRQ